MSVGRATGQLWECVTHCLQSTQVHQSAQHRQAQTCSKLQMSKSCPVYHQPPLPAKRGQGLQTLTERFCAAPPTTAALCQLLLEASLRGTIRQSAVRRKMGGSASMSDVSCAYIFCRCCSVTLLARSFFRAAKSAANCCGSRVLGWRLSVLLLACAAGGVGVQRCLNIAWATWRSNMRSYLVSTAGQAKAQCRSVLTATTSGGVRPGCWASASLKMGCIITTHCCSNQQANKA